MLQAKIAGISDFPDELKTLIEHMLISHHGQYEFGSPKLPMFPEALMLHYLDDLDSKMEAMRAHFEREALNDSPWTSYNASLGRPLLNTAKFLEKKEKKGETPQGEPSESSLLFPSEGQGEAPAAAGTQAASDPLPTTAGRNKN
jgi:3'-5' exoribonuclease